MTWLIRSKIFKLATSTGSQISVFTLNFPFSQLSGMANDGQDLLLVTPNEPFVGRFHASDGSPIGTTFFFDPSSPFSFFQGFEALAFSSAESQFVPVTGTKVFRFREDGGKINEFNLATISKVRGAVFVGSDLLLAEDDTQTIQRTSFPTATAFKSEDPRGMASDGSNLYLVLDNGPKDKIVKIDPSNSSVFDSSFGTSGIATAPGAETEGIAFLGGFLYVVDNDRRVIPDPFGGFRIEESPVIHKLNATTGSKISKFRPQVADPFDPFQPVKPLIDKISALASDGTFLYAGVQGPPGLQGVWFKIDPNSPSTPAEEVIEFPGQLNFMPGFEAFDVTVDPAFPADRQLLATGKVGASTRADTLSRFDIASGEMFDQFALSGTVDIKGLAYVTSTKTLFLDDTVIKATSGTKWDIASVTGGSAAWHIACQGDPFAARVSSASCSWRYAVQNQGSFDTGARTEGTLTTSDFLPVSAGTQLTFFTGFNTELQEGADLKLVEMQTPGTDFRPLLQIVGKGGGFAPQPTNAHATFQFQELDPLFVNPNLVQVTVSLAEFAGNQVKIRFKFDSVDAFANGGEGWYVDDIVVSGSGTKILQISTTAIDPPVSATVNGTSTTMFREFQFGEPLDEGQNIITVEAVQPYTPFLSDTDQVSGFADTTAPVV